MEDANDGSRPLAAHPMPGRLLRNWKRFRCIPPRSGRRTWRMSQSAGLAGDVRYPRCPALAFNLTCALVGLLKDAASGMGRAWSLG
jgi:hypothetical protein